VPDALARTLVRLLADQAEAQAMGARGRQLVLERFTWERVAHRLREAYEAVLAGGTADPTAGR